VRQRAPGAPLEIRGEGVAEPGAVRVAVEDATLSPAPGIAPAEMPIKGRVDLETGDVAPIAAPFLGSLAASGPLKGSLAVEGTASRPIAKGVLAFDRLLLSAERPQCRGPARRELVIESLRLPVTAGLAQVESAPATATVARGTVTLRAVVVFRPATVRLSEIAARSVELGPVLVEFLCHPYAMSGPLDLDGELELHVDHPLANAAGAGRLRIGRGRIAGREITSLIREVTGIGSTVAALAGLERPNRSSALEFDSITATYSASDGVVRTNDLLYRARDVTVRGAGTYALTDNRVAMEMTLSQGANQLKGFVSGTPGSLRLVPTGAKILDGRDVKKFLDGLLR